MTAAAPARIIATWLDGFGLEAVSSPARHEALRSVLDTVGVSIAGAEHESCRRVRDVAAVEHGHGPCTVLGARARGAAGAAALVNGVAAHALDFDDVSYEGMVHASAVVWPAVLAAGEMAGVSGRRVLEGFIAGVEVDCALGRAFTHELFWRGFWTTGLLGAIAAAAGVAKTLDLDADASAASIEIAAAQASGLRAIVGSAMKPVACGLAAETGLRAALLARAGIRGTADLLRHRHGFAALVNGGVLLPAELERLATHQVFAAAPMAFKRFPICSYGQAAVEALLEARGALGVAPVHVRCEVAAGILDNMPYGHPSNASEAQFSLIFALGAALAYGDLTPAHLDAATLADPRLHAAMSRVECRVASGAAATMLAGSGEGAVVTLLADGGGEVMRCVRVPTGMPERPISDAQLDAKFDACVGASHGAARAAALRARIHNLEHLPRVAALFADDA